MSRSEAKVPCRTPNLGKSGVTNIPSWKFDAIRRAILAELDEKDVVAWSELTLLVKERLSAEERASMGNVGWFTVTVKLEMEVRGEIERLPGAGPQKIRKPG